MNYLKTALNFLKRNKLFASINILGLSLALSVSFLMLLYIVNELSFNSMHKNRAEVFRIINHYKDFGRKRSSTPYALATDLKESFPQVEKATNTSRLRISIQSGDEWIKQIAIATTSDIFDIFTIPILEQTKSQYLLKEHNNIVISNKLAKILFGDKNPLGKSLTVTINEKEEFFDVVAVCEDMPKNSSLQAACLINKVWGAEEFQAMIPIADIENDYNMDLWGTWIKLADNNTAETIQPQFKSFLEAHGVDTTLRSLSLQSLSDYYLNSSDIDNSIYAGNKRNLQLLSIIVTLILLVATFNYITLSTAISASRAKEIGVRKTNGASLANIRKQLLSESVLVALFSLPLSVFLMYILLPFAEQLFHHTLRFIDTNIMLYLVFFLALPIFVGLLSGLYSSSYLSRFKPIDIINKKPFIGKRTTRFRSALIVVQLVVFCVFVASGFIIHSQYKFAMHKDLGFRTSNIVFLELRPDKTNAIDFLRQVQKIPDVVSASGATETLPTLNSSHFRLNHFVDKEKKVSVESLQTGLSYLETLGVTMKEGRYFSENQSSDIERAVIVNEAAVKILGIDNPIGRTIQGRTIIGVTHNFIFHSIHSAVPPLIVYPTDKYIDAVAIHYHNGRLKNLLPKLEKLWNAAYPYTPFSYRLSDEIRDSIYQGEQDFFIIIALSGLFTLLIATLGLFGITLFITQSRTKEIGVRKVMGSSEKEVMLLLLKGNILKVIIASVIAIPISYTLMSNWLQGYVYKTNINLWHFVLTGIIALAVVLFTVSWQSYRAASRNPVEALRYE